MGTRSITIMCDGEEEIAVLYRQFDGYPSGMGADIAAALGGKDVVNGYSASDQISGGGDMAVQLIAWLKKASTVDSTYSPKPINSPGGLYLYPPGTRDCGEEYVYTLTCHEPSASQPGRLNVKCEGYGEHDSFEGTLPEFVDWIASAPWDDEDD